MRQLIRGHLRGRARVHLAGDLHFYMRHSFIKPGSANDVSSKAVNGTTGTTAEGSKPGQPASTEPAADAVAVVSRPNVSVHKQFQGAEQQSAVGSRPATTVAAGHAGHSDSNTQLTAGNSAMPLPTDKGTIATKLAATTTAAECAAYTSSITPNSSVCSESADHILPCATSESLSTAHPQQPQLHEQNSTGSQSDMQQASLQPASINRLADDNVNHRNGVPSSNHLSLSRAALAESLRDAPVPTALGYNNASSMLSTSPAALPKRPSSVVGGSSDDESESGFSTTSARSWHKRITRYVFRF